LSLEILISTDSIGSLHKGKITPISTSILDPPHTQIRESGKTNLATDYNVIDWVALSTQPHYPYVVTSGFSQTQTYLMQFDKITKQFTNIAGYGSIAGNTWGSGYSTTNGNIYAADNVSGETWTFPISGAAPPRQAFRPPTSVNDGARCTFNGERIVQR